MRLRGTRVPTRTFGILILSLVAASVVASPARGDTEAGPEMRTGLLVFPSYRSRADIPVDPRQARLAACREMSDVLSAEGHDVVGYPEIEPHMQRRRIRSERDLSREFLAELANDFGIGRVVVARVVIYEDRILLLARGIDPASGTLEWADMVEEKGTPSLRDEAAAEKGTFGGMVSRATRKLRTRGEGENETVIVGSVVLMPLRTFGFGRELADLVLQSLLISLLRDGRWRVPDPAIVVSALQGSGFDPLHLSRLSRREMARDFGTDALLIPRMVAYGGRRTTRSAPPGSPQLGRQTILTEGRNPVYLAAVLVDCESGELVSGRDLLLEPPDREGWFGVVREEWVVDRFRTGSENLVSSLLDSQGD